MLSFILRRLASIAVVMTIVGIVVFLLVHLAPGDPAAIIAGNNATPQQAEAIRQALGLDRPLMVQFLHWALAMVRGDLGVSISSGAPVATLIAERIEPTISLAVVTLIFTLPIALVAGVIAAARAGSFVDRGLMGFSALCFSMPAFVVGYLLVYVFAINLRWLPVQGYSPIANGLWPWLERLILPATTLGLAYLALIARVTRTAVLDTLAEDYIRTAKAKGIAPGAILMRHAFRNAGVPVITIIGIGIALLIGGVVITETVFNIPGIGRLVFDAIQKRDYPIIQGITLVLAGVYVLVNLLIDLSYGLIDPRVRY